MRKVCIGLLCALLLAFMAPPAVHAAADAISLSENKRQLFDKMEETFVASDYAVAREFWDMLREYHDAPAGGNEAVYDWTTWEYVRDFLEAWDALESARAGQDPQAAKGLYEAVYETMLRLAFQPFAGSSKMPDKCRQLAAYVQAKMYELDGYPIYALGSYRQVEREKMVDDTLLKASADSPELKWQEIWQDAAVSIVACQKAVYSAGVALYNQENYEKSREQFAAVTDYKDSGVWIEKCDQAIARLSDAVPADHVLSNLQFIQVTGTSLSVRWDSTLAGYAYEVAYAPQYAARSVTKITAQATQAELTGLIPSTRYALTITALDSKAAPLTGERETLNVGPFTDYSIKWPTIALYSYKQADASSFGIKHVVDTNKIVQVGDAQLSLPRFRIADDAAGSGYVILISFMCEKTQTDKEFPCRFVLRIRDGGTYEKQINETIAGGSTYISLFSPVDDLLDAYYDENNGWKEAAATLDFYVRDQLLASYAFTLKP